MNSRSVAHKIKNIVTHGVKVGMPKHRHRGLTHIVKENFLAEHGTGQADGSDTRCCRERRTERTMHR